MPVDRAIRRLAFSPNRLTEGCPKTPLYALFREYFQLEEDLFFCHILNRELVGQTSSLAKLQLLVGAAYDQGDPYAIGNL